MFAWQANNVREVVHADDTHAALRRRGLFKLRCLQLLSQHDVILVQCVLDEDHCLQLLHKVIDLQLAAGVACDSSEHLLVQLFVLRHLALECRDALLETETLLHEHSLRLHQLLDVLSQILVIQLGAVGNGRLNTVRRA